jgi:CRP/FNR family transcriptional regulator
MKFMKTVFEKDSEYYCDIQAPCFQELLPEEVKLVQQERTQVLFRKGDSLTKQGTFGSYVLFIVSGYVKQYIEGEAQRDYNLRIIKPGEFVGLSIVFSGNTFNYSSVALTECRAFLIDKSAVASLAKKNGNFGFSIIKRYCELNDSLFSCLNSVIFHQMNGRLAGTLLYLNGFRNDNPEIFQLLSRKELAEFAGISMESAVKLLKSFEKDGLIKLHEKDINILDPGKLAEISRRG